MQYLHIHDVLKFFPTCCADLYLSLYMLTSQFFRFSETANFQLFSLCCFCYCEEVDIQRSRKQVSQGAQFRALTPTQLHIFLVLCPGLAGPGCREAGSDETWRGRHLR